MSSYHLAPDREDLTDIAGVHASMAAMLGLLIRSLPAQGGDIGRQEADGLETFCALLTDDLRRLAADIHKLESQDRTVESV